MPARPHGPLHPLVLLFVAVVVLALATVVSACGDDSGGGTAFAGDWTPADSMFEIAWTDTEKWYAITFGGKGGGLEIGDGEAPDVVLVGKKGNRSAPLPATVDGQTLTFEIPLGGSQGATKVTLSLEGTDKLKAMFGESGSGWEFVKTDSIPTE